MGDLGITDSRILFRVHRVESCISTIWQWPWIFRSITLVSDGSGTSSLFVIWWRCTEMRSQDLLGSILLTITLLIGGGGFLLWARNRGRGGDILLQNAEKAYQNKQLRTAEGLYQQYLINHPADDQRRARHALIASEVTEQPDAKEK